LKKKERRRREKKRSANLIAGIDLELNNELGEFKIQKSKLYIYIYVMIIE